MIMSNMTLTPKCTRLFAHIIRLHSNKGNKTELSRDTYETGNIWWYNHLRNTTNGRIWQHGKGWYFWFDDIKMGCKHILSMISVCELHVNISRCCWNLCKTWGMWLLLSNAAKCSEHVCWGGQLSAHLRHNTIQYNMNAWIWVRNGINFP